MKNTWNPWHGCTKISPGCLNCYVYRIDNIYKRDASTCVLTQQYDLPIRTNRHGEYKIPPGTQLLTCFSSDFFLEDADIYRDFAWNCMRIRTDLRFLIITKRIYRFMRCIPYDWGNGWDNVSIACTVENQDMANYRLPIFRTLPIKHKSICAEPLLEYVDLKYYLSDPRLEYVICGGESGPNARPCNISWVMQMNQDCIDYQIPFCFKQTGARLVVDDNISVVARKNQFTFANSFYLNSFNIDDTVYPSKDPVEIFPAIEYL